MKRWALFAYLCFCPQLQALQLIIIGDSLTAGYGVKKEEAYPYLLEKKLQKLSPQHKVLAAGVSGSTTASSLYRVKRILKKEKPSHIMLALGGNDALRGLPVEGVMYNLESAIKWVRANHQDIRIVLAGMKAPPSQGADYTKAFDAVYPNLSKKYNLMLLPFLLEGVAGDSLLNQNDQIHPNAQGHQKIADHIFLYLQSHL